MGEYYLEQNESKTQFYKIDPYNKQRFLAGEYEEKLDAEGNKAFTFKIFTHLINVSSKPKEPDYIVKIDSDLVNLIPKNTYQIRFIFINPIDKKLIYWVPYKTLLELPYEIGIGLKSILTDKQTRPSLIKNEQRAIANKASKAKIKRAMAKEKREYQQSGFKIQDYSGVL